MVGKPTAHIFLNRVRENAALVRERVPPGFKIIGVVKSDAYGHGAAPIARTLFECGTESLAVSDMAEALALREDGVYFPTLVLGDVAHEEIADAVRHCLTLSLSDMQRAEILNAEAVRQEKIAHIHINADTGMGRFGFEPRDVLPAFQRISSFSNVHVEGIFSHLSTTFLTDPDANTYTRNQIKAFDSICKELARAGLLPKTVHLGSSTGLIGFPESVCGGFCNAIRVGTLFLGYAERPCDWKTLPRPAAEVRTQILAIKDKPAGRGIGYDRRFVTFQPTRLAILPVGYGDGLHRDLAGKGHVLVEGQPAPIIGKLTLGQTLVDVTHLPSATEGSEVLLAGPSLDPCRQGQTVGRGTWEILLPLLKASRIDYRTDSGE